MKLTCYAIEADAPTIRPAPATRPWMDAVIDNHAYRCLPLTIANSNGWDILAPFEFTAEWNGGLHQNDIRLWTDHPHPDFPEFAKSHFSHGIPIISAATRIVSLHDSVPRLPTPV